MSVNPVLLLKIHRKMSVCYTHMISEVHNFWVMMFNVTSGFVWSLCCYIDIVWHLGPFGTNVSTWAHVFDCFNDCKHSCGAWGSIQFLKTNYKCLAGNLQCTFPQKQTAWTQRTVVFNTDDAQVNTDMQSSSSDQVGPGQEQLKACWE